VRELVFLSRSETRWRESPEPRLEGPGEALVRPVAVACCDLDVVVVQGRAPLAPPYRLGHEGVAEVMAVGQDVVTVAPGEQVIVPFQISCGACPACRRGNTESCQSVPERSMYGLGPIAGHDGGGFMSDLVRVPYADAMLVALPAGIDPAAVASASDNVPDAWRCVGPYEHELAGVPEPDRRVLVMGGLSIGLYAVGIARALGARVDYVDTDPTRCAVAARFGARITEGPGMPKGTEPFPVVVNTSADPEKLRAALGLTWPGGVCTDTGIYYGNDVALPLLAMYGRGLRFVTGRVAARAVLPPVLSLVADGRFDPGVVAQAIVAWDAAQDTWPRMTGKTVYVRT
jgi:threonine dehydrogenase-like Zn-dependent dehydrogenase